MNKTGLTLAAATSLFLMGAQEAKGGDLPRQIVCDNPDSLVELAMRLVVEKESPDKVFEEKKENCVVTDNRTKLIGIKKYAEVVFENKNGVIAELDVEYNGPPQKTYALKLRDKENGPEEREH